MSEDKTLVERQKECAAELNDVLVKHGFQLKPTMSLVEIPKPVEEEVQEEVEAVEEVEDTEVKETE